MKIRNIYIAKEKFKNIERIENKLSCEKWVEYIEANQDYFTWYENTADGIYRKNNMHEVPEHSIEKFKRLLNKRSAYAEFNAKKGWYEVIIGFIDDLGLITTTFQRRVKKKDLEMLLEMANYLDAYVLNGGSKIIDEKFIDEF